MLLRNSALPWKVSTLTMLSVALVSPQFVKASERAKIEEIVVTAQKREENIRDVPISVTALSADFISDAGITDVNELSQFAPNVVINAGPAVGFVAMRGLGSGNNKGFERSVAVVIDGIYYGRQDYLFEALADVERLEVLRGPQGTLFGKNAIAGALNITSGSPSEDFTGSLSYMGGELDRSRYQLAMGGEIIPDFASVRISASVDQFDGFVHNTASDLDPVEYPDTITAGEELGSRNDKIGRIKLSFPELLPNLSLTLTATDVSVFANSLGTQITQATPEALEYYRRYDPKAEADPSDGQTSHNGSEDAGRDGNSFSAQFDYYLGEHTITAIFGHSYFDRYDNLDGDMGADEVISLTNDDYYEQSSAELRISSPPGKFEYVAGLYQFDSTLEGNYSLYMELTGLLEIIAMSNAGLNINPEDLLGLTPGTLPGAGVDLYSSRIFDQNTEARAVFGQATWNVTDKLALIAGLRYSEEEKDIDAELTYTDQFGNVVANVVAFQVFGSQAFDEERQRKETDFSPKFSLRYELTEEINLYATYARAFKAGGFNEQAATSDNLEFEPEKAQTWEAGAKMRFADGLATLNIGLFHTSFEDLQVSMYNGINFSVGNAASAISQGVEIEGRIIPANWLDLQVSVGWLDAYYDSYPDAPCPADSEEDACDLTGETLARAPEFEVAFGPRISLTNLIPGLDKLPLEIGMGLDALYRSDQLYSTDLDPFDGQEAVTEVNAQLRFAGLGDDWSFVISGRNITDENILAHSQDVPLMPGTHFGTVYPGRRFFAELRYQW